MFRMKWHCLLMMRIVIQDMYLKNEQNEKILLSLFCVICLSVNAQIQRNFLNFKLGLTSLSQVKTYFRNHGKEWKQTNNSRTIQVHDVQFGGVDWKAVFFEFYKGKLYLVHFQDLGDETPRELLDSRWKRLYQSYMQKYQDFLSGENYEDIEFDDGITRLVANYSIFRGYKGISLIYYDIRLFNEMRKSDNDEL